MLCSILFLCSGLAAAAEQIKIGGSGAALGTVRLLAQEFGAQNPDIGITIVPNLGSSGGVKAVTAGAIGLGALLVAVALACIHSVINALKSRRSREAIAFRKALAAGRAFFVKELRKEQPALRDEWYPWLLAFELGKQVDEWSTGRASTGAQSSGSPFGSSHSTSHSPSSSSGRWTGFGGGRSGGAGGGASWQAAASGMAASVAAPSSSRSSGSSSSSGGSSSSSSGGGGGGGW